MIGHGRGKKRKMKKLERDHIPDNNQEMGMNIEMVSKQIEFTMSALETNTGTASVILEENIGVVISWWTGDMCVGKRKDAVLQRAFQEFFERLYKFILVCKNTSYRGLQEFAQTALYEGTLYRYLGNSNYENVTIEPEYDHIWASWSKNKRNPYFVSKLKGVITHVTCHTGKPRYGIDLDDLGWSRAEEAEVVYPMVEENIDNVEYYGVDQSGISSQV